jgi:uncharacterized protein
VQNGLQSFLEIDVGAQHLAACLHRPVESTTAPIVVCCHGLTGTRIGSGYRFVELARRLGESGIACLRFDFRGCGESDGRFIDVTAESLAEDLRAVLAALPRLGGFDTHRIGIAASSFGAHTVSGLAEEIKGLKALVFLAPVADPRALIEQRMPKEAWDFLRRNGWIDHHGLPLGAGFIDTLPNWDAPRRLAATRRPLLVYHGTKDAEVPLEQGQAYVEAVRSAGVEASLEPIETGDHGMRSVSATRQIVIGAAEWMRQRL